MDNSELWNILYTENRVASLEQQINARKHNYNVATNYCNYPLEPFMKVAKYMNKRDGGIYDELDLARCYRQVAEECAATGCNMHSGLWIDENGIPYYYYKFSKESRLPDYEKPRPPMTPKEKAQREKWRKQWKWEDFYNNTKGFFVLLWIFIVILFTTCSAS